MNRPDSTAMTRWVAPGVVLALGTGLSVWVKLSFSSWRLGRLEPLIAMAALPVVAIFVLVGIRLMAGRMGRHGDLIVTWLMAFLMAMHAMLLGLGVGVLRDLSIAVPIGTGVLLVGLSLPMAALEFQSAMGIRISATLGDEAIWRRAHRLMGAGLAMSGISAGVLGPVWPFAAMGALVLGPALSLVSTAVAAKRWASSMTADEESPPAPRPKDAT